MVDFSVVVCTYNGAARLPAVLAALRSQQQTDTFGWEILIVDNHSQDATATVVQDYQQIWPEPVALRYAFEPRQGLAYARRCAIQTVQAEWVGFIDDDTVPASDWVSAAYRFAQQHPTIGAYGSEILGDYAVEPPPGFQRIASCLAVIERGSHPFAYARHRGVLPAGAGMVIRRQAWLSAVPDEPKLTGVCAQSVRAKGEDIETLSYLRQRGWTIWHNPQMRLFHRIPQARLERPYLLTLFHSIGSSRYPLRMMHYASWQRAGMTLLYAASDLRKLLLHLVVTRQLFALDVVTACERRLLLSSLFSPIYYWQTQTRGWIARWLVALLPDLSIDKLFHA
ncbi:MAG: glycosyltransferase family 2 protein [Leptolyngbya sp. SIO4C1]|nr:glycosyltransferase family 2 protein [Leptolyngbya sp. SIO4C1]